MINIFGGETPITKQSIANKADVALNLFRIAIYDLKESSSEAEVLRLRNQTTIDELTVDNDELEAIVTNNDRAIEKMEEIVGG